MSNLIGFGLDDIPNITSLYLAFLVALFLLTGRWKRDIFLMVAVIMTAICWTMIANLNEETAGILTMVGYTVLVITSIFKDEIKRFFND